MRIEDVLPPPNHARRSILIAALTCALLAACSPQPEPMQGAPNEPATNAAQPAVAPDAPGPTPGAPAEPALGHTIGGDGSPIELDALTEGDLSGATLSGELACSFSVDDDAPLLLAMGAVASDEPAQGIVKVSGYVEPIRAPGGFDGMLRGATFTGRGKTIVIEVTGDAIGGGESPPVPATLAYQRADGASRTFDGRWQCGP
jgi:hypothetical protein